MLFLIFLLLLFKIMHFFWQLEQHPDRPIYPLSSEILPLIHAELYITWTFQNQFFQFPSFFFFLTGPDGSICLGIQGRMGEHHVQWTGCGGR